MFWTKSFSELIKISESCASSTVGIAEAQGWRPSMEDAFVVELEQLQGTSVVGVFDGHGGAIVSRYAAQALVAHVAQELLAAEVQGPESLGAALVRALGAVEGALRADLAGQKLEQTGSTAICVAVDKRSIASCWLGDSRAVLSVAGSATPLSFDHRPSMEAERARITRAGAHVFRGRVNGTLAVSRALGDTLYKAVAGLDPGAQPVSAAPECVARPRLDADEFVVVACDGVWEKCTNQQAVAFVRAAYARRLTRPHQIARKLVEWCLLAGSTDNMTAAVYLLNTATLDNLDVETADAQLNSTDLAVPAVFDANAVLKLRRPEVATMSEADVQRFLADLGFHHHVVRPTCYGVPLLSSLIRRPQATFADHHVDGECLLEVSEEEFLDDLRMPLADARFMTLALQWWEKTSRWL